MTELATGLNYWTGTNWTESVPDFQASPSDGAFIATRVQHHASISSEINVQGAIGLRAPTGQFLSSTPVGIALYDPVSGQSLLLATVTNTIGTQVSSNQIYFDNAFRGGACASILYTIERDSFAQDIVFSGFLDPAAYGFATNTARIQIITELFGPPAPDVLRQPMYVETNLTARAVMATPDVIDETLTFGDLVIGVGEAYTAPSLLEPSGASTLVAKEFVKSADGRYFLVETVPYSALQRGFYLLPDCSPAGPTQGHTRCSDVSGPAMPIKQSTTV
ncbi:MAG TPA: hypothetical protein VKY92_23345 [Verrucomicrobiae bacterium]|nr:hypothetical protein [Verrucomicrobiae bacterium]